MADETRFQIPEPQKPNPGSPIDQQLLARGALEQKELAQGFPEIQRHYDWVMRFVLKPALFFFVLWINWWWDSKVMQILFESGRLSSGFHLSDSVLIALITTSIANFLVLIHIVAKHLFPERREKKENAVGR